MNATANKKAVNTCVSYCVFSGFLYCTELKQISGYEKKEEKELASNLLQGEKNAIY